MPVSIQYLSSYRYDTLYLQTSPPTHHCCSYLDLPCSMLSDLWIPPRYLPALFWFLHFILTINCQASQFHLPEIATKLAKHRFCVSQDPSYRLSCSPIISSSFYITHIDSSNSRILISIQFSQKNDHADFISIFASYLLIGLLVYSFYCSTYESKLSKSPTEIAMLPLLTLSTVGFLPQNCNP